MFGGLITGQPSNTDNFLSYAIHRLGPELRAKGVRVLIMDNVRYHHCESIRLALTQFNVHVVYLSPYTPWNNPCEQMFNAIKLFTRKHSMFARTFPVLCVSRAMTRLKCTYITSLVEQMGYDKFTNT